MAGAVRRGTPFQGCDGKWYLIALSHDALAIGTPYIVTFTSVARVNADGDTVYDQDAVTAACDAVASIPRIVGICQRTVAAAGEEVTLELSGQMDALVEGTTDIAVGNFLKIAPGGSATCMVYEGTTITASSVAVALEAETDTSEVLRRVFVLPINATGGRVVNT